jgi:signal transduction histidine kinase
MTSRPNFAPRGELSSDFVRERHELMLRRTRVAILLGGCIVVAFIGVDAWRIAPERYPRAVVLRSIGACLLVPMLAATRLPNAKRWAAWIATGTFAILMASTASIMPLFHGASDPQYAIQGTGMVLCILGAGLLLPFDWPEMLGLGLIALGCHVAFTLDFPLAQNFPVLVATVCSVVIATVGARELSRSRRADFEGRRAKEELLRARSDFVAMLTHDIRNPLAVIDGFVQMLRERPDMPDEERDELLARVHGAVRNAITLAVNFLDTSRIEANRFILKTGAIDLHDMLARAVADQGPFATKKGVRLLHDSEPDLPVIDADAAALDRVFANLLSNAVKHTPAGGMVRIAGRRSGPEQVEIVVEDTGEGIPSGEEARIFERYTQATTRADSTGLGLFIARTITTAHGGTIFAENRRDGPGARFSVVLPAAARVSA